MLIPRESGTFWCLTYLEDVRSIAYRGGGNTPRAAALATVTPTLQEARGRIGTHQGFSTMTNDGGRLAGPHDWAPRRQATHDTIFVEW